MSDIVDFKLTLNDKEFTASIKNAGKLLDTFGKSASNNSKKMSSLERSVVATGRSFSILNVALDKGANKMEDFAAGAELAGNSLRAIRENIAAINRSLSVFSSRLDIVDKKINSVTSSLRKLQSEFLDLSDYMNHAGRSAKSFTNDVSAMGNSASSLNRRLSNTSRVFDRWKDTTDKAADGLKNVIDRMDAVIDRQRRLSGRILGGGRVGGNPGNDAAGSRGSRGSDRDRSIFSGMRSNIFLLGEVGDAARLVTDVLFSWQKPIIESAAEIQKMEILLQGLNKNKADPKASAATDMDYIIQTAKSAPFAMRELTDSFVKFKSAGLDPLDGSWRTLIDSVARFGGSSELMNRAAVAIQQMSGKGVISMEELRQQLGEAVPTAMQAMADAMGVTMATLTKQISTGTVSAKEGLRLLFLGLDAQNRGAAKTLMQAYTGALAQMQTAFTLFSDKVGKAGYLTSITNSFKEISSFLNSSDGSQLAAGLGSGLSSLIDSLTSMAKWITENKTLIVELGKILAAFVGFKLLRSSILGVMSTGRQMGSVLGGAIKATQVPFDLLSTAVTRFGRASSRNLGTLPSLLFAIRGGLTAIKAAFASVTALIVANPIGAAITAVAIAVSGLVYAMSLLKDKTAETVEEILKIPSAMNAASRAKIMSGIQDKERELAGKKDERAAMDSSTLPESLKNRRIESLDLDIKNKEAELARYKKALGVGDAAVKKQLAMDVYRAKKEEKETALNKGLAIYSSDYMEKNNRRRDELEKDTSLSKPERIAAIEALNKQDRDAQSAAYKTYADAMQKLSDTINKEVSNLDKDLKNKNLTSSQRSELQARRDGQADTANIAAEDARQAQTLYESSKNSRNGTPGIAGNYVLTGAGKSGVFNIDKASTEFAKNMSAKLGNFLDENGLRMKDAFNNPISGNEQYKTNQYILNQLNKAGKTIDQLDPKSAANFRRALEDATKRDAQLASKRETMANGQAEMARVIGAKVAEANQKVVSSANELAGQLGFTSKASVGFSESVKKTLAQIDNALKDQDINGKPLPESSRFSADQKQELIHSRDFIKANAADYAQRLDRDSAEQTVSKFTMLANGISSSYDKVNRSQAIAKWQEDYKRDIKTLQDWVKINPNDVMTDVYKRTLKAMQEGGNRAFIEAMGTATQKLAVEYGDVATQIETAWSNAFSNMNDTITDFIMDGKASFSDFARSVIKDIVSIYVKSQITLPLMNMLGMGTGQTATQTSGGSGNIIGAALNQGVSLISSAPKDDTTPPNTVNNGDLTVDQSAKGTSNSVSRLGQSTQEASSGIAGMVSGAWDYTKSLFNTSEATKSQTGAIKSSIFSMNGLAKASSTLSAVFAMMGASSSSKSGKWLGFAGTVIGGLVSAYAGGSGGSGGSGVSGDAGSGGAIGSAGNNFSFDTPSMNYQPNASFAKGGIFGPNGVIPVSMRAYSKGGIATTPQLALFGEGDQNEAYVPLPDGRSIPVTLTGSMMGSGGGNTISPVSININVQSDGSGSSDESDNSNWNKAAERMKSIALETIAQEKRPGGSLNQNTNGNR